MSRGVVWRELRAPAYERGNITVTPMARAFGIRWRAGGWLWLFPTAIEVQKKPSILAILLGKKDDGPKRIPIINFTHVTMILFGLITLLVWLMLQRQATRQ